MIDDIIKRLELKYGYPSIGKLKSKRSKQHTYIRMNLDYATEVKGKINMNGIWLRHSQKPLAKKKYLLQLTIVCLNSIHAVQVEQAES